MKDNCSVNCWDKRFVRSFCMVEKTLNNNDIHAKNKDIYIKKRGKYNGFIYLE